MAYLFDTNIFIASKNAMPIELWPTFWTRMTEMITSGQVFSINMVKDEISKGKDELCDWIKSHAPSSFFLSQDSDILIKYAETQQWAQSCPVGFTSAALNDYAANADAYLVATAAAKGMTIVTYEKSQSGSKKRVKIPDACAALNVSFCDLNYVIRSMGLTI